MVNPRPLKLRAQVASLAPQTPASELPIASIWVDNGIYHLDEPFDYLVPAKFSADAQIGVRVEVPFGATTHEGLILERKSRSENSGKLKSVQRILSPHAVATAETIELFRQVARRWAGTPYDVIRGAIPPRVASVDKAFTNQLLAQATTPALVAPSLDLPPPLMAPSLRSYWAMPAAHSWPLLIAQLAIARSGLGQVLLIAPDARSLDAIERELLLHIPSETLARLDGQISRSERYQNFLRMKNGLAAIAIGLRGAIFTPLGASATIIVAGESSELLYEPRSPGWNVRDIAIMRNVHSKENLILLGFSPSLEVSRLIDIGWISIIASEERRSIVAAPQSQGELLSSKAFSIVRKNLSLGPILFLVPRKGYGNAVLCNKCRNLAICSCGGKLQQSAAGAPPICVLCFTKYLNWSCQWCQGSEIYLAARGIERFIEEIGRSFPGEVIINSSGENILASIAPGRALVVATAGSEPEVTSGYSAVLLLESLRFLAHTDLRSNERVREQFFKAASLICPGGAIFIALDPVHPIVAGLVRWSAAPMVRRELQERDELCLPPYFRFVIIEISSSEASLFKEGLLAAQRESRLPKGARINGPHEEPNGSSTISLSAPLAEAEEMVDFLHEIQRRRAISKKNLLGMRVDPYSLS